MAKLFVHDLEVAGKRVFVRVDYNVPMEEKNGTMAINDITRIRETLPTLQLLIDKGAKVILAAHLGRPDGTISKMAIIALLNPVIWPLPFPLLNIERLSFLLKTWYRVRFGPPRIARDAPPNVKRTDWI